MAAGVHNGLGRADSDSETTRAYSDHNGASESGSLESVSLPAHCRSRDYNGESLQGPCCRRSHQRHRL